MKQYADLPEGITSFGAAVAGDWLYTFGGHKGKAHDYSIETQSSELRRLNLHDPQPWETVAGGPPLQGLALVACGGKLYRMGGFTAHNRAGEDHDLRSVADFSCYDPESNRWQDLPPMPDGRSSMDAVVIDQTLYVAGGWEMGPAGTTWHDTALACNLADEDLRWLELPKPPFQRRALALGHADGKLYVIGGIDAEGQPTTAVDVLDPAAGAWTKGPNLVGDAMEGFGCAAFTVGGKLHVSTSAGDLQRLDDDGKAWDIVAKLDEERFFHRMVPLGDDQLLLVGGTSRSAGKILKLRSIDVAC